MLRLRPGDRVAVVAPSGPAPVDRLERGLTLLAARGYRFTEPNLRNVRYLSAPDEVRLADLHAAIADPEVRAIFTTRGGYGAMRLLERLDARALAASRKVVVGFSDIGALHCAILRHGGRAVHGPVLTQLGEQPPDSVDRLFRLLEEGGPPPLLEGRTVVPGAASGPLIGGCLSVISRLVGTPYLPNLRGAVLLLEDVGEQPYRLDRMWTHLKLAGVLDEIAAVVFGTLTGCETPGADFGPWDVVDELLRELGKPAIAEVPVGHGAVNLAVPLGARVTVRDGGLQFDEAL